MNYRMFTRLPRFARNDKGDVFQRSQAWMAGMGKAVIAAPLSEDMVKYLSKL